MNKVQYLDLAYKSKRLEEARDALLGAKKGLEGLVSGTEEYENQAKEVKRLETLSKRRKTLTLNYLKSASDEVNEDIIRQITDRASCSQKCKKEAVFFELEKTYQKELENLESKLDHRVSNLSCEELTKMQAAIKRSAPFKKCRRELEAATTAAEREEVTARMDQIVGEMMEKKLPKQIEEKPPVYADDLTISQIWKGFHIVGERALHVLYDPRRKSVKLELDYATAAKCDDKLDILPIEIPCTKGRWKKMSAYNDCRISKEILETYLNQNPTNCNLLLGDLSHVSTALERRVKEESRILQEANDRARSDSADWYDRIVGRLEVGSNSRRIFDNKALLSQIEQYNAGAKTTKLEGYAYANGIEDRVKTLKSLFTVLSPFMVVTDDPYENKRRVSLDQNTRCMFRSHILLSSDPLLKGITDHIAIPYHKKEAGGIFETQAQKATRAFSAYIDSNLENLPQIDLFVTTLGGAMYESISGENKRTDNFYGERRPLKKLLPYHKNEMLMAKLAPYFEKVVPVEASVAFPEHDEDCLLVEDDGEPSVMLGHA